MMKMKMKQGDMEKEAKLRLLEKLSQEMSDLMTEHGFDEPSSEGSPSEMQQVTVAAPDKESLAHGLDKAEDVIQEEHPSLENMAGMHGDADEMSLDDLDEEDLRQMFKDEEDEE